MAANATIEELARSVAAQASIVSDATLVQRQASASETNASNCLSREKAKLDIIKQALALKLDRL